MPHRTRLPARGGKRRPLPPPGARKGGGDPAHQMTAARLGPQERDAALRAMADTELDVLVVGGGIVGAGVALDAVARGLSVGLVEARDFASEPPAGPASSSTGACATWSTWTSLSSARRSPNAACSSAGSPRTWCARCRSCSRSAPTGNAPTSGRGWPSTTRWPCPAPAPAACPATATSAAVPPCGSAPRCAATPSSAPCSTGTHRWTTPATW